MALADLNKDIMFVIAQITVSYMYTSYSIFVTIHMLFYFVHAGQDLGSTAVTQ